MHPRMNILGFKISAINMDQALNTIADWLARRESNHYVCVAAAHVLMDSRKDPALREAINGAGMITPDGMSLVWLLQLHGYHHAAACMDRIYYWRFAGFRKKKDGATSFTAALRTSRRNWWSA